MDHWGGGQGLNSTATVQPRTNCKDAVMCCTVKILLNMEWLLHVHYRHLYLETKKKTVKSYLLKRFQAFAEMRPFLGVAHPVFVAQAHAFASDYSGVVSQSYRSLRILSHDRQVCALLSIRRENPSR